MANSASLLQRLLRRPCTVGPPKWKGERPCRAAVPLLRTLRKMLSAKDPHGDSPLGGDLHEAHAHVRFSGQPKAFAWLVGILARQTMRMKAVR